MQRPDGKGGKRSTSRGKTKPAARRSSSTHRLKPAAQLEPKEGLPAPRFPKSFPSYEAASAWLHDRINVERSRPSRLSSAAFRLERMRALMEALGNPHRAFRSVHVAGSKGKGSVCEMTAAALQGCGYTTGLYTSPHVVDLRERIRIDQRMIPESAMASILARCSEASEKVARDHEEPSFFELLTAAGFLYFADQAVDIAVIEVGLGGRLDATNVITPEVSAITAIQLEHVEILGDTLEKIAREKAGIIKPGVPVLTYAQNPAVLAVFQDVAASAGSPLQVLGTDIDFSYRFEASPELGPHVRVCLTSPRSNFEHIPVPLKGEHQAQNCGLALAILDRLRARGMDTPEAKAADGLSRTPNHARLEQVWSKPRIIVDGAHNPESVHALVRSLGACVKYDSLVVIFGCALDKDIPGMLAKVALGADKVIFTRSSDNPRSADPRDLLRKFAEISPKMAQAAPDLKSAINIAARAVARDDLICVTGSFYLAGEAKKLLLDKRDREAAAAALEAKPATDAKPTKADPKSVVEGGRGKQPRKRSERSTG